MSTTATSIQQLHDGSAAGAQFGRSDDLASCYGKAPIAQQTDPSVSGSALVASIHSIAVYAASLGNRIVLAMSNFGIYL